MEKITLSHGSGGIQMHRLIDSLFLKQLGNDVLRLKKDSAVVRFGGKNLAFTTDSYVVNPIFFPGGDIGMLSVYGTVNDLAVCGARPLYLSLGLVIEEGLERTILEKITRSINAAAKTAGVKIVTGDTKVVEKGSCDKLFINTSGIGEICYKGLSTDKVRCGDSVIISGPIGDHAISVMSRRDGISFAAGVMSDASPLNGLIGKAMSASKNIRFMRDPTRGGLGTTLNEIVDKMAVGIMLDESAIPVRSGVRRASELLGLDPLYLSCEGRVVLVVASMDSHKVLRAIRSDRRGKSAQVIGVVCAQHKGRVVLRTSSGGKRIVPMMSGEQLPRIC
jgi:hydrogenase expression/formation protein HypE